MNRRRLATNGVCCASGSRLSRWAVTFSSIRRECGRNNRDRVAFPEPMSAVSSPLSPVRPDRIVPALPIGSGMLFWLLQAAGWGGFGFLMFLWGLTHLTPAVAFANKLILVSLGIAATMGMRAVFGRARRDAWPAGRIVALTLAGTSVIAVVWSELHLVLFDALLAVSSGRSWTPAWIDLYPGTVLTNFLVLNAWCLGYFAVHAWVALDRERTRARVAEKQAHEARLRALQSQLEPHFLFNALNAVSTLVAEQRNGEAQQMLSRLADFLRRTLDAASTPEVSVAAEVELARQYVEIQTIRFGDRLRVRFEIDPEATGAAVPVLILQPIIENAVVHGALSRERGGTIDVCILRDRGKLRLRVTNDGPGRVSGCGNGLGLSNTRSRLAELYGDDHELWVAARPGGGTCAELLIPFRLTTDDVGSSEGGCA